MSQNISRRLLGPGAMVALMATSLPPVTKAEWPVKLVVPHAAGGTTELIARRLGEDLERELEVTNTPEEFRSQLRKETSYWRGAAMAELVHEQ